MSSSRNALLTECVILTVFRLQVGEFPVGENGVGPILHWHTRGGSHSL